MSKKILAVDDSGSLRQMLSFTLRSGGYQVVDAVDGVDGLKKAQASPCDLVLTDQNMPNMDGLEACRRLRAIEAQAQEPRRPVFALTGKAFAEDIAKCQAAGMDGHLAKPIQLDDLMGVLRTVQGAIKRH